MRISPFSLFALVLLVSARAGWAQASPPAPNPAQRRIDSLEMVLRQRPGDTTAVNHHNELAYRFQETDQRNAFQHARAALRLSRQLRFARGEGKAHPDQPTTSAKTMCQHLYSLPRGDRKRKRISQLNQYRLPRRPKHRAVDERGQLPDRG